MKIFNGEGIGPLKINYKNKCDGVFLLKKIPNRAIKAVFFDPQYRGVLDKLKYGNEGKLRGKLRSALPQMDEIIIHKFLLEINRVLVPSGYLFLWVDKFHLVEGIQKWFKNIPSLSAVDMITWNKLRIGMGYRTRRKSEYCIVIQKRPQIAKNTWKRHDIPDVWEERVVKNHTHAKPIELQKNLILAVTEENDFVVDPAAGGYSVLRATQDTKRNFIGGDIEYGEDIV
ncbi:MAG: site-specific DNA-methyltransferase [Alphaproteobacteria bacterium]|nr:site-specific DNA-methyltransferase [Alphaproteobacteria bacterium]